jgi:hypothetical protein
MAALPTYFHLEHLFTLFEEQRAFRSDTTEQQCQDLTHIVSQLRIGAVTCSSSPLVGQ